MTVSFGRTPDGVEAALYTLENAELRVRVSDYGGRIVSIEAPGRSGARDHVVLGFDSVADYVSAKLPFGALLGRTANRIAGGSFTLDGRTYHLSKNEGNSTLHGGLVGFDKVFWRAKEETRTQLVLAHTSPDGDQGFPGTVEVSATYRLDGATLWLEFEATTDKPTPLSLSAHPYFNLGGLMAGNALAHEVEIAADHFLPTDEHQIPTGEIRAVADGIFDFRTAVPAKSQIRALDSQLLLARGYDHYYVLRELGGAVPVLAARIADPASGRMLEILTTQPGVQFYTGNKLDGSIAGRARSYRQSDGLAFEPQGFPNAPNEPGFPSTILRPGASYRQSIGYRFGLR